ncbi:MAG: hypothetical protein N3G22_01735 [Candidatus Micrarchaeota archaeon]|nr:hypothetical protein [Candidatus Micrarchaeota archaeon]
MQKSKQQNPKKTAGREPSPLKELELKLNEEKGLATKLRKPRGVRLSYDEIIKVAQARGHLPPLRVVVDGVRYSRTYDGGNPASEALVRINLEQFIREVKRVAVEALRRGEAGKLVDFCRSYEDGIKMAGFFTASGLPLAKNRAFSEAIKQFFKDERLVLKIISSAMNERIEELRAGRKLP